MEGAPRSVDVDDDARPMTARYIGVVVTEVIVLLALWALGAYFG